MLGALLVLAAFLLASVNAKYICDTTGAGPSYPFCINIPDKMPSDNCGGKLPLVLYLGGQGTRGVTYDVYSHTTWDGVGVLLNQYRQANYSLVNSRAANRFLVVQPMATYTEPGNDRQGTYHYWPQNIDQLLATVRQRYGKYIDDNRIHCLGYSMGSRGCWRYSTYKPSIFASITSIGGAAEAAGGKYIQLEPATTTFNLLSNVKSLPIRIYGGSSDTTAPLAGIQQTHTELLRVGAKNTTMTTLPVDHTGLQTAPFQVELLDWILAQRKIKTATCSPVATTVPITKRRRQSSH